MDPDDKQPFHIELDWMEYWKEYQRQHGEPVVFRGRFLFEDGRTYAMDPTGPEWLPPEDPVENLEFRTYYAKERLRMVLHDEKLIESYVRGIEQLQKSKSVTLQQKSRYKNHEDRWVNESGPVDLSDLKGRLLWLKNDIMDCEKRLAAL